MRWRRRSAVTAQCRPWARSSRSASPPEACPPSCLANRDRTMTHSTHPIGNAPPYGPTAWAHNGDRALARARLRRRARSGPCAAVYALGILGSSVPAFTVLVVRASLPLTPATLLLAALAWLAFVYLARWMTWVDRSLAACWAE